MIVPLPPGPRRRRRHPARGWVGLGYVLLAWAAVGGAIAADDPSLEGADADLELPPELTQSWLVSGTARLSAGWRDNVGLSAVAPQSSALLQGEVEAFLWRLPVSSWELLAFATFLQTHYLDASAVDDERVALGQVEGKVRLTDRLQARLAVLGLYQDEVLDLTVTEAQRTVADVQVLSGTWRAGLRAAFFGPVWFDVEGAWRRDDYVDFTEDYEQAEGWVRLGATTADGRGEISLGARAAHRDYDERTAFTLGGRSIAGSRLAFHQREFEARLKVPVGADGLWRGEASVGYLESTDSATGYFDYQRTTVRGGLEWRPEPWRFRLQGSWSRYAYPQQFVGIGENPDTRWREARAVEGRAERAFGPAWTVFATWAWEDSRANEAGEDYHVNTGQAGVTWSW